MHLYSITISFYFDMMIDADFVTLGQEYPAVEIYPSDVIDVQVGSNALFQCLASTGSPTLTWRR